MTKISCNGNIALLLAKAVLIMFYFIIQVYIVMVCIIQSYISLRKNQLD